MARFIVERVFPDGLEITTDSTGAAELGTLIERNGHSDVTWVTSYVSADRTQTFCVYDAPDPDAIRRAAEASDLPVDKVTEVRVLDPYFYVGADR